MSVEINKTLVRRYFDEFLNQGKLHIGPEILESHFVFCSDWITIHSCERFARFVLMERNTFPDLHYVVDEGIAEGDRVVTCFTMTGSCVGQFFQQTQVRGRKFSVKGVAVFRISEVRISEVRSFCDTYSQMQQLGFVANQLKAG